MGCRRIEARLGAASVGVATAVGLALVVSLWPMEALADNDAISVEVARALEYSGRRKPSAFAWFMLGSRHNAEKKALGRMVTRKSTSAFGRSDQHACGIAFQSAIIQLQERARRLGGNTVVDIVSIADGETTESKDSFRCSVGKLVATVHLEARAVVLEAS